MGAEGAAESDDPCLCLRNIAKRNYAQLEQPNSPQRTRSASFECRAVPVTSATTKVAWLPARLAPPAGRAGDPRAF